MPKKIYLHNHTKSIGSQRSRERYSSSKEMQHRSYAMDDASGQKILLKSYREYHDDEESVPGDFQQQVENFEKYFAQNVIAEKSTP